MLLSVVPIIGNFFPVKHTVLYDHYSTVERGEKWEISLGHYGRAPQNTWVSSDPDLHIQDWKVNVNNEESYGTKKNLHKCLSYKLSCSTIHRH